MVLNVVAVQHPHLPIHNFHGCHGPRRPPPPAPSTTSSAKVARRRVHGQEAVHREGLARELGGARELEHLRIITQTVSVLLHALNISVDLGGYTCGWEAGAPALRRHPALSRVSQHWHCSSDDAQPRMHPRSVHHWAWVFRFQSKNCDAVELTHGCFNNTSRCHAV